MILPIFQWDPLWGFFTIWHRDSSFIKNDIRETITWFLAGPSLNMSHLLDECQSIKPLLKREPYNIEWSAFVESVVVPLMGNYVYFRFLKLFSDSWLSTKELVWNAKKKRGSDLYLKICTAVLGKMLCLDYLGKAIVFTSHSQPPQS